MIVHDSNMQTWYFTMKKYYQLEQHLALKQLTSWYKYKYDKSNNNDINGKSKQEKIEEKGMHVTMKQMMNQHNIIKSRKINAWKIKSNVLST